MSILEEVVSLLFGDCGHRKQLGNSLGLEELQLYLLTAQGCHHKGVTEPPGWVSPALNCTNSTKLDKFNKQLLRDSARIYCQWSLHGLHRSFHLLVETKQENYPSSYLPPIRKGEHRFLKSMESD